MISPPQRRYRLLRAIVGVAVIAVVVGMWVRGILVGEPLDTLWTFVVLVLAFAAAITVFGRRTFEFAFDTAQQAQGNDDGEET
jgi:F0F1-type ATP synthase assembly protein I